MKGRHVFVFHPGTDASDPRIERARDFLRSRGAEVLDVAPAAHPRLAREVRGARLVVTFGGDGTLLLAARAAVAAGVPLLGVNLGRLGFLTCADIDHLNDAMEGIVAGRWRIAERTVISWSMPGRRGGLAINEAALHRAGANRLLRLVAEVNGYEIGRFDADGILVASATGSTAYSLSAGGPILDPSLPNLVLTQLNAFTLASRPLVLKADDVVTLQSDGSPALLTVDGQQEVKVREGEPIRLTAAGSPLRLLQPPDGERFFQLLREKIRWGTSLIP